MRIKIVFLSFSCFMMQSAMSRGYHPNEPDTTTIDLTNQGFGNSIQQLQSEFQYFLKQQQKEFDDFRKKQNEEFAFFIEKGKWVDLKKEAGVKPPKEKEVRPIVYNGNNGKQENKELPVKVISDKRPPLVPQPTPGPIKENSFDKAYNPFTFYGTQMMVRWSDLATFKLKGVSKKSLAEGYKILTSDKYNNLLSDCLQLRKQYALCDWAYYKMLEAMTSTVCGKGTNEATFLHGVLYQQSGYTMRFALEKAGSGVKKLRLLVRIKGLCIYKNPISVDGKYFYSFDSDNNLPMEGLVMDYKNEQDMQMDINELPHLEFNLTEMQTRTSDRYKIEVQMGVNKNQLKFMEEYPTTYDGNDFMTRWAYYANTQASEEIREIVYPQLRERLKGADELLAVNMLLNWVQTGFEYERDVNVWKRDRAFFAEETLHYKFSDCEDRAILFSRLVRDLVGLDVILVFYSGKLDHLSTAVCFTSPVDGYCHKLGGRVFVEADPCFINAKVGSMMNEYIGTEGKAILLKR